MAQTCRVQGTHMSRSDPETAPGRETAATGTHPKPSSISDEMLVASAQRGDTAALGALYDRHAPMLLTLARFALPGSSSAEDLVHDVFMEAWRKIRTFDPARGTVRAWLTTILRSRAIDRRRAEGRRRDRVASDGEVDGVDAAVSLETVAERPWVRALVAGLSPIYREALIMTYFEGRSLTECAAELEVPVGTVKARVSRAVQLLRTRLAHAEGAS